MNKTLFHCCVGTRRHFLMTMAVSGVLALSGCATLTPDSEQQTTVRRSGRFSGKAVRLGKGETLSGRYRLTRTASETLLELMTPLYGVLGTVRLTDQGAELEKAGEVVARASDSQTLMQQSFGFSLPAEMLEKWLIGKPDTRFEHKVLSQDTFEQAGWSVSVRRRHASGIPAVISVGTQQGDWAGSRFNLTIEEDS